MPWTLRCERTRLSVQRKLSATPTLPGLTQWSHAASFLGRSQWLVCQIVLRINGHQSAGVPSRRTDHTELGLRPARTEKGLAFPREQRSQGYVASGSVEGFLGRFESAGFPKRADIGRQSRSWPPCVTIK